MFKTLTRSVLKSDMLAFQARPKKKIISNLALMVRFLTLKTWPDHTIIDMPALSPTMSSGNLAKWNKKPGDKLEQGDVIAEIETDKAQMDFENQDEGFLAQILVKDGTNDIKVGTPIAVMVEEEKDVIAFKNFLVGDIIDKKNLKTRELEKSEKVNSLKDINLKSNDERHDFIKQGFQQKDINRDFKRIFASPFVRQIALEKGISLARINGSGPNGRIVKEDIANINVTNQTLQIPFHDIQLSNVRRIIAERLLQSKNSAPHYYLSIKAQFDKLNRLRNNLNEEAGGQYKISLNDFIIKAVGLALKQSPKVNASFMDTFIREYENIDVCVAVATQDGLITPIIKDVPNKSILAISQSMRDLSKRARENKLRPEEYQGGTFTVSNLGMYGIDQFTAIINPPQSCILAVGAVYDELIMDENDERGFRNSKFCKMTMSADHRAVDGAIGAAFMASLKKILENPLTMMVQD